MMETPTLILTLCVLAFTLAALVCDVRTRRLPNLLTVPAIAAGLLFHGIDGFFRLGLAGTAGGLLFAVGGFATGFGIVFVLWLIGGSGGGDVKFMGALGSWLGAWTTFQVLVASAVFAGLCTFGVLVLELFGLNPFSGQQDAGRGRSQTKRKADTGPIRASWFRGRGAVPFAVPATLATWTVLALQWAGHGLAWPPSL